MEWWSCVGVVRTSAAEGDGRACRAEVFPGTPALLDGFDKPPNCVISGSPPPPLLPSPHPTPHGQNYNLLATSIAAVRALRSHSCCLPIGHCRTPPRVAPALPVGAFFWLKEAHTSCPPSLLLLQVGLDKELMGAGPFTLFAPGE